MLRSLTRPSRSAAVLTAFGVLAALALQAPARGVAACQAGPARHATHLATRVASAATPRSAPLARTASAGEVARDDRCDASQLPPLAILAAALATLAVPRCRQGGLTEL